MYCFDCLGDDFDVQLIEKEFNQDPLFKPEFKALDLTRLDHVLNITEHPKFEDGIWLGQALRNERLLFKQAEARELRISIKPFFHCLSNFEFWLQHDKDDPCIFSAKTKINYAELDPKNEIVLLMDRSNPGRFTQFQSGDVRVDLVVQLEGTPEEPKKSFFLELGKANPYKIEKQYKLSESQDLIGCMSSIEHEPFLTFQDFKLEVVKDQRFSQKKQDIIFERSFGKFKGLVPSSEVYTLEESAQVKVKSCCRFYTLCFMI